jgi:hypothetical protein
MRKQISITVLLASSTVGLAQTSGDWTKTLNSLNSCPGGGGTAIIDTIAVPSLDKLVRLSDLIVVGSVVNVLPGFTRDSSHVTSIETDSLVSVTQTLWGTIPISAGPILLFQLSGTVGSCTITVPDDPLVKSGEQYVLFLVADNRKQVPNSSGVPRYSAIGVWSGKAKIVDGKIQFPARASAGLQKYDSTDEASFLAAVKHIIQVLSGMHLLHSNAPITQ